MKECRIFLILFFSNCLCFSKISIASLDVSKAFKQVSAVSSFSSSSSWEELDSLSFGELNLLVTGGAYLGFFFSACLFSPRTLVSDEGIIASLGLELLGVGFVIHAYISEKRRCFR